MEKLLKEHADKLREGDRAAIQAAIDKVNRVKDGDDANAIKQAIEELQRASQAMAQHLYGQGGPGAGGGPGGGEDPKRAPGGDGKGGGKDDVIDAEFEVKK
jgi:molecular chaperone DnaK